MVKTNTSSGIRAIGDSTQEQTTIDPALETYIRVVERMLGASQAQPKKTISHHLNGKLSPNSEVVMTSSSNWQTNAQLW